MKIIKEIESVVDRKKSIELHIYETPEEVVSAMFGKIDDIVDVGGFDGNGSEYHMTLDTMLSNIKESGCWGFSGNKKAIHVWFDKSVDLKTLIHLFAHERGHLLRPYHRDEEQEEIKAERYGDTAVFAYEVATELLSLES